MDIGLGNPGQAIRMGMLFRGHKQPPQLGSFLKAGLGRTGKTDWVKKEKAFIQKLWNALNRHSQGLVPNLNLYKDLCLETDESRWKFNMRHWHSRRVVGRFRAAGALKGNRMGGLVRRPPGTQNSSSANTSEWCHRDTEGDSLTTILSSSYKPV